MAFDYEVFPSRVLTYYAETDKGQFGALDDKGNELANNYRDLL